MPGKRGLLISSTVISTLFLFTAVTSNGNSASATDSCGDLSNNHCYGQYYSSDLFITQISADIEADCLNVHDTTTQFDTFEMWMFDYPALGNYWIEEGLMAGDFPDTSGIWYNGFQWFWADNRPNGGGFHFHHLYWASNYDRKTVGFVYQGGSTWKVEVNGSGVGTATGEDASGSSSTLGAETAVELKSQVYGHAWNWHYYDTAWHPVHPSVDVFPTSNPPGYVPSASFNPTNVTVKTPNYPCGHLQPQIKPKSAVRPAGELSLRDVRRIAVTALGSQVTGRAASMSVVQSTRGAANDLSGSTVTGPARTTCVYLVQELGSFTAHVSSRANPDVAIKGGAVTVVIDAKTGVVLDWGIQSHPERLRSLGKVTDLHV
jgi:hypothetical protein